MSELKEIEIFKPDGTPPISYETGLFKFEDFERIKKEAIELSRELQFAEVTEENIKVNKKLVASVRARLKELDGTLKVAKNDYLKPYDEISSMVKEINDIVEESENVVRSRITQIEDKHRQDKLDKIELIWNKRMKHSEFGDIMDFWHFAKPQYTNKTFSIDKTETEMVEYITRTENEIRTILSMDNADQILPEYIASWNMQEAIRIVTQRVKIQEAIDKTIVKEKPHTAHAETSFTFTIEGEDNIDKTKSFLDENNIKYS